jgi:hypothetical protein
MSIEIISSTDLDDNFWQWVASVKGGGFFSVRKGFRYHAISYDQEWGYVCVQYEPEELPNGKLYSPLVMLSDFRRVGRKILKKWDKEQIRKTKIICAFKIATYVFEVDGLEAGGTRTPGDLTVSFHNMESWLDPLGKAHKSGVKDVRGHEYVDWMFDRNDWQSGVYHEMYRDAIENF